METKKEGRPTKLTQKIIDALNEVLEEKKILIMNDEELVMFINEKLPESEKISYSSFMHWKTGKLPETNTDKVIIEEFLQTIKKALYIERDNLFTKMQSLDNKQWTRFAWIIERKFDEWNLKSITDSKVRFPDGIPPLKADVDFSPENIKKINDVINCC